MPVPDDDVRTAREAVEAALKDLPGWRLQRAVYHPQERQCASSLPFRRVGPNPADLQVIGVRQAAELSGRDERTVRQAVIEGHLHALGPTDEPEAGRGLKVRLRRTEVEQVLPPTSSARARQHQCTKECAPPAHVTYIAASMRPNREVAEYFLRRTHRRGSLQVMWSEPAHLEPDDFPLLVVNGHIPDALGRAWSRRPSHSQPETDVTSQTAVRSGEGGLLYAWRVRWREPG